MWRPFARKQSTDERSATLSISDPALVEWFGLGFANDARIPVSPQRAMALTAVYRAVSLISGTLAGLPLKTYRQDARGLREQVPSYLDDPAQFDGLTPFEVKEHISVSLLLHGNAYLQPRLGGAGTVVGLRPIAPQAVAVERDTNGVITYRVTLANGSQATYGTAELIHIRALSTDGIVGLSPIAAARQSIGTGLAGDKTAAKQFGSGLLMGGIVTPQEDIPQDEAEQLATGFRERTAGHDNAAGVAFINRKLAFSPWAMNARDAQFIEARSFQVEEVARLYGLPVILLADSTKTTSWGAGVAEVIAAMQKFTLAPWTNRIAARLNRTLGPGTWCEFDYHGLLETSATQVTANLAAEIAAGIRTVDEARRILNLPPLGEADANAH